MIIENFTNFDYAILSIIFISTIFAFVKGFTKSIISIFGWIITISTSYLINPYLSPIIKKFISNSVGVTATSLLVSFISAMIISSIFTGKLYRLTENIRGGFLDRLLGAGFGTIRGLMICCIIVISISGLWKMFFENKPNFLTKSEIYPIIEKINEKISTYLPNSVKNEIDRVGKYKNNDQILDFDSTIDIVIKTISKNKDLSDIDKYIDKLKNKNVSESEKYKILELIYQITKDSSQDYESNKIIKELLDNKGEEAKKADKMHNQLERLMESNE